MNGSKPAHMDDDAFDALVARYANALYAFAYGKSGDFHLAQDIVQEAFIKAYLKLHTLKDPDKVGGWLYTVTSRLCTDAYRKGTITISTPCEEVREPSFESDDGRECELLFAVKSLPESLRIPLSLFHIAGYATKEIAGFMGITPKAVENRLRKARRMLKEEIFSMAGETLGNRRLTHHFEDRIKESIRSYWESYSDGKLEEAETAIQQAIDNKPGDPGLRGMLAHILSVNGKYAEAEAEYLRIVETQPHEYLGLGKLYLSMGRLDKAEECFRKNADLTNPIMSSREALADLLYRKGDRDTALRIDQNTIFLTLQPLVCTLKNMMKEAAASGDIPEACEKARIMAGIIRAVGVDASTIFPGWTFCLDAAGVLLEGGYPSEALDILKFGKESAIAESSGVQPGLFSGLQIVKGKDRVGDTLDWFMSSLTEPPFCRLAGSPGYDNLL